MCSIHNNLYFTICTFLTLYSFLRMKKLNFIVKYIFLFILLEYNILVFNSSMIPFAIVFFALVFYILLSIVYLNQVVQLDFEILLSNYEDLTLKVLLNIFFFFVIDFFGALFSDFSLIRVTLFKSVYQIFKYSFYSKKKLSFVSTWNSFIYFYMFSKY